MNTMPQDHSESRPWYRQFWLWFVLTPPIASIVLGVALVIIATTNGDSLVADNYSRVGRALHRDDGREQAAEALGVRGTLVLDRDSGQVSLLLQGLESMPEHLDLLLSHPTHADRDVRVTLQPDASGLYRGNARQAVQGRHYLRLQPDDGDWLIARVLTSADNEVSLAPDQDPSP